MEALDLIDMEPRGEVGWVCPSCGMGWRDMDDAREFWRQELVWSRMDNDGNALTSRVHGPSTDEALAAYTKADNPCCPEGVLTAAREAMIERLVRGGLGRTELAVRLQNYQPDDKEPTVVGAGRLKEAQVVNG